MLRMALLCILPAVGFFDDFSYELGWTSGPSPPPSTSRVLGWPSPGGLWLKALWDWDHCLLLPQLVSVAGGHCLLQVPGSSAPQARGAGAEIVSATRTGLGLYRVRMQASSSPGGDFNRGAASTIAFQAEGHGEIALELQSRVNGLIGHDMGVLDLFIRRYALPDQAGSHYRKSLLLPFDPGLGFHTYALDWREEGLAVLVDGRELHRVWAWETWLPPPSGRLHLRHWTGNRLLSGFAPEQTHVMRLDWVGYSPAGGPDAAASSSAAPGAPDSGDPDGEADHGPPARLFETFGRAHGPGDPLWRKATSQWQVHPGRLVWLVPDLVDLDPGGAPSRLAIHCETRAGRAHGGMLSTEFLTGHGSYRARLRVDPALPDLREGCVNAFFYWCSEAEIDFEFRTRWQGTLFQGLVDLVLHHTPAGGPKAMLHLPLILDFDPSQAYHEYGFDWRPDRIDFLIDGRRVWSVDASRFPIPRFPPGRLYFNNWTNHPTWGGDPPSRRATMEVDWAIYSPLFLAADRGAISLARGGTATLFLEAGRELAGKGYAILGSLQPLDLGLVLAGVRIPLEGHWSVTTLMELLPALSGTLDGEGKAVNRGFRLPAGLGPELAGLTFQLAAVVYDRVGESVAGFTPPLRVRIVE